MEEYFEIKNNKKIKFKEKLELTKDFDDILFIEKPSKKIIKLRKEKDFYIYQLLINKYEFITYEILSYLNLKKMTGNGVVDFNTNNNMINIAGINIVPAVKGFDADKFLLKTAYPGGLKYFTTALNPYLNTLTDKTICIIKFIGPWEINNNDELELYFHEELYLNTKNKVKTIFTFVSWNSSKKYKKIINGDGYDYIVVDDLNDNNISKFMKGCDVVIIDKISVLHKFDCADDNSVLVHTLFLVNEFLSVANNNADLIFLYTTPHIFPHYQLYYYLYRHFKTMTYYKSILSEFRDGIFVFRSFDGLKDNLLKSITTKYSKIDESFGKNIFIKVEKSWCNQQGFEPKNKIGTLISSLYQNTFSNKFNNFMDNIKKHKEKVLKLTIKKMEYLQKYIYFNGNFNLKKIKTFIFFNIDESIKLLESNNIEINDFYKKNVVINSINILKSFFPNINDNLLSKIQFSRDSIYSISSYDIAEKTSMLIKTHFPTVRYIIDGTANIGGNSFNFSKNFSQVVANELSTSTFNNLKNNIRVLNLKNIQYYNNDIIKLLNDKNILKDINFNKMNWCLFLDPPWSGIYYKLDKVIDLYFGNTNVSDFLKEVNVNYICMKVPKNFNFSYLFDLFSNIKIIKVIYCYIILIDKSNK